MNRIGWAADEMQHHPEWTLGATSLQINLSTHDIGNKVSLKDYILAVYIESVLFGSNPDRSICELWNKKKVGVPEAQQKFE